MVGSNEAPRIAPINDFSWETYQPLNLPRLQYSDEFVPLNRPFVFESFPPRNTQQQALPSAQSSDAYNGETTVNQYSFVPAALDIATRPFPRPSSVTSAQSIRNILADESELTQPPTRKRQRKEEFVKLPQPEKKQKASQQVVQPLVPPIIVGIHEPPPNQASKFRPIVSTPFHDSHGRNSLNTAADETRRSQTGAVRARSPIRDAQPLAEAVVGPTVSDETPLDSSVRTVQARNMWTEEETRQLLLGVQKHGMGNWKKILDDDTFSFNNRKAVHLKDRFRTCFPDGSNGEFAGAEAPSSGNLVARATDGATPDAFKQVSGPGNMIIPGRSAPTDPRTEPAKKSRAHRKSAKDLLQIGIVQPFSRSRRRPRRAFTEQEDRNILLGFERYGASSWTLIQRDPELGLQSRRPTDIRDRFRNRYSEKHREMVGQENNDGPTKGSLRRVVSIEELVDPNVGDEGLSSFDLPMQPLVPNAPSTYNQHFEPAADLLLPPISFNSSYPDILGGSGNTRLPKMSYTELLSGPLPTMNMNIPMNMPDDTFSFPDWTTEDYWLPEIQTQAPVGTNAVGVSGSGSGSGRQKQSVYDISSICGPVEPDASQGAGGG